LFFIYFYFYFLFAFSDFRMMPHAGAMRLHLLLALTRVAVGYPAGDAQQVLSPPSIDSEASSGRKLSGRFLHITGKLEKDF
jgi:hypothetical protein